MSRLECMETGAITELLPAGDLPEDKEKNSGYRLWRSQQGYMLMGPDGSAQTCTRDECDSLLAPRFALPACGKEDLSSAEKYARRVKEAKIAAAKRKAEMEAAIKQATLEWQWQQAELAAELGISCTDWRRIVQLLSSPPAKQINQYLVMNSVAVGEAVVIGSAVHAALSEPLKESVRHAAKRAEAESAAGAKKPREPQITQTPFGMDVTEMMPLMQAASERQQGAAAAKKRRLEEAVAARARKTSSAAAKACKNLLEKKDADKLSITDLVALIKWRGGAVPKDTSKNGKPELVRTWRDLAVPEEAIRAESAGAEACEPPAAPQRKKQKRRAPESDDEESEDEQSDDEEGSEEESDDDEQYTARAVTDKKGKGKSLRYLVDWEPERDADGNITQAWDPTWEKPEDICDTLIEDYEAEHS